MDSQPRFYPEIETLSTVYAPNLYSKLDRANTTKVYNSGFPKNGINLCLEKCPGADLPATMFETTEDLQKLGALYMGGTEAMTESSFDLMVASSFPDDAGELKNSLWCEKVASDNNYDALELCQTQKVMMPSSTIVHMCTPHYKIALAVAKATMAAEENASGRSAANNGTTDASWADRVSEAGNAVIANQRTIFICFLGAAVVAALVILIIQILTKYLIYRKVLEKFKLHFLVGRIHFRTE